MNAARAKVEAEGRCRVCLVGPARLLDAAHLVPRSLVSQGFDDPDAVVPLCSAIKGSRADCHGRFDAHELDLLPHLTVDEEIAAVRLAKDRNPRGSGIAGAYRLLSGGRLESDEGSDVWSH